MAKEFWRKKASKEVLLHSDHQPEHCKHVDIQVLYTRSKFEEEQTQIGGED